MAEVKRDDLLARGWTVQMIESYLGSKVGYTLKEIQVVEATAEWQRRHQRLVRTRETRQRKREERLEALRRAYAEEERRRLEEQKRREEDARRKWCEPIYGEGIAVLTSRSDGVEHVVLPCAEEGSDHYAYSLLTGQVSIWARGSAWLYRPATAEERTAAMAAIRQYRAAKAGSLTSSSPVLPPPEIREQQQGRAKAAAEKLAKELSRRNREQREREREWRRRKRNEKILRMELMREREECEQRYRVDQPEAWARLKEARQHLWVRQEINGEFRRWVQHGRQKKAPRAVAADASPEDRAIVEFLNFVFSGGTDH